MEVGYNNDKGKGSWTIDILGN